MGAEIKNHLSQKGFSTFFEIVSRWRFTRNAVKECPQNGPRNPPLRQIIGKSNLKRIFGAFEAIPLWRFVQTTIKRWPQNDPRKPPLPQIIAKSKSKGISGDFWGQPSMAIRAKRDKGMTSKWPSKSTVFPNHWGILVKRNLRRFLRPAFYSVSRETP